LRCEEQALTGAVRRAVNWHDNWSTGSLFSLRGLF
jgi:hypothetical protein